MSEHLTTKTCSALKDSLLDMFAQQVDVSTESGACVLTFPWKTVDGRYVEVHVEPTVTDYVIVHDGGNAVTELFLQGVHMSEARAGLLTGIARRYGASFSDNTFTIATRQDRVAEAILAIAQCTSVAMIDLVKHKPVIEDEVIAAIVRRTLKGYRPGEVDMRYRFIAKGESEHTFDAVAFPRMARRRPVAVKTLGTAYSPKIQSERYGYLALDLRDTAADEWPRLAVIAKVERWNPDELAVVRRHSTKTLELKTGEDHKIEQAIQPLMDSLAEAA